MSSEQLLSLRVLVSYIPAGLYVESMHLSSAILSILASKAAPPVPLTGCIKDLGRIWRITPSDVLSDFDPRSRLVVASLRHGNTFPLVNRALLSRCRVIGRRAAVGVDVEDQDDGPRPTFVHVTFVLPVKSPRGGAAVWPKRVVVILELVALTALSTVCFHQGQLVGGLLLLCQVLTVVLLLWLQHAATFVFANKMALEKDMRLTAARGAAVDAHVVVEDWNATDMDVVVGYSSQVHALTNLPVRFRRWRTVIAATRLLGLVLVTQATILAAVFGMETDQAWGSAIWLVSYAAMHLVAWALSWRSPDMALDGQPARAIRVPPLAFFGRKAALAFIATLKGVGRRQGVGQWDWCDGFMPNNERRKEWAAEFSAAYEEGVSESSQQWSRISDDGRKILAEVRAAQGDAAFKAASQECLSRLGWQKKKKVVVESRSQPTMPGTAPAK